MHCSGEKVQCSEISRTNTVHNKCTVVDERYKTSEVQCRKGAVQCKVQIKCSALKVQPNAKMVEMQKCSANSKPMYCMQRSADILGLQCIGIALAGFRFVDHWSGVYFVRFVHKVAVAVVCQCVNGKKELRYCAGW